MAADAKPRLRILLGESVALGPGKARLLAEIAATGSISAAARAMGMSYRRAWLLVAEMNRAFRAPLVDAGPGGKRGGGAQVTELGRDALARYCAMEAKAQKTLAKDVAKFVILLKSSRLST
jgi:molybdate transport system regulatory protein